MERSTSGLNKWRGRFLSFSDLLIFYVKKIEIPCSKYLKYTPLVYVHPPYFAAITNHINIITQCQKFIGLWCPTNTNDRKKWRLQ